MARFLTGLFGSSKQTSPPATSLRVNTSLQGVPIALLLGGSARLAGNLIDYYGFNYQNAPSSSGGKGGITSGGGKGQSGNYNYFASFVIALCEGPVQDVSGLWIGGTAASAPSDGGGTYNWAGFEYQAEAFFGDYSQLVWGYTEAVEPSHALGYRGICYGAFGNFPLGSSTSLPNFTFEVLSSNTGAVPGQPDGYADIALTSFLTDVHFGLGFPVARLGSLNQWRSYCVALGFGVSPVIASTIAASSFVTDLAGGTNSAPCWQDGMFTVVPYGDASVTAGQVVAITETHVVPPNQNGTDGQGNPLYFPYVEVSFFALFAGDVGVKYQSGTPLTKVSGYSPTGYATSGSPLAGQYYEQGGIYYFSPADIGQTVLIGERCFRNS